MADFSLTFMAVPGHLATADPGVAIEVSVRFPVVPSTARAMGGGPMFAVDVFYEVYV